MGMGLMVMVMAVGAGAGALCVHAAPAAGRGRSAVRKDWRSMSGAERKQFTDAVNALKRHEQGQAGLSYDSFVYLLR
jgi:hypothetical protein